MYFLNTVSVCSYIVAVCVFTYEHLLLQINPLNKSVNHK